MGYESYERNETLKLSMMEKNIKKRILDRILFYGDIHERADSSKVANPAYEEMIVSIIEIIYKFNGLEDLFLLTDSIQNDAFKLKLNMFLIIFDKNRAIKNIESLEASDIETVAESANNVILEKYSSIESIIIQYKSLIEKIARKRKLTIPNMKL